MLNTSYVILAWCQEFGFHLVWFGFGNVDLVLLGMNE
jgi:hypothetical protein